MIALGAISFGSVYAAAPASHTVLLSDTGKMMKKKKKTKMKSDSSKMKMKKDTTMKM